jgi:hypothetical protein
MEFIKRSWRPLVYGLVAAWVIMALWSTAHAAGYTKPLSAPAIFVPNYGVEVSVFAAQTGIGHGIGVFERSGTGDWTLCFNCLIDPEYPTLDSAVNAAGGAGPYVASKLQAINAKLAERYPAVMAEPIGSTLDKVNGALATNVLRLVNGIPMLGAK